MLHDVPLAPHTTLRVGGNARRLLEAHTEQALIEGALQEPPDRCLLLGGGSNLLVSDGGFDGLVVAVRTRGITQEPRGDRVLVTAAAGEIWDDLVAWSVAEGLGGLECMSGIPGLVGAVPIQNVGAYGQEVSDTIVQVRALDRLRCEVRMLAREDCAFRYRDSAFKSSWPGRFAVLAVSFSLRPCSAEAPPARPRYKELEAALAADASPSLSHIRATVLALRRKKSMVLNPEDPDSQSAGSFFTNPVLDEARLREVQARVVAAGGAADSLPAFDAGEGRTKIPAAWLIESAGFRRGLVRGPHDEVGLSSKHALAIVSRRGATAAQIVALAREIQLGVAARFGVWLEPEPVLVGFSGSPLSPG